MQPGLETKDVSYGWQIVWALLTPLLWVVVSHFVRKRGQRCALTLKKIVSATRSSDLELARKYKSSVKLAAQSLYQSVALVSALLFTIQFGILTQLGQADTLLEMFSFAFLFMSIMSAVIALMAISVHNLFGIALFDDEGDAFLEEEVYIPWYGKSNGYLSMGDAIAQCDLAVFWLFAWAAIYLWMHQPGPGIFVVWMVGYFGAIYANEVSYALFFSVQKARLDRHQSIAISNRIVPFEGLPRQAEV